MNCSFERPIALRKWPEMICCHCKADKDINLFGPAQARQKSPICGKCFAEMRGQKYEGSRRGGFRRLFGSTSQPSRLNIRKQIANEERQKLLKAREERLRKMA